jgi:hypothetical protein
MALASPVVTLVPDSPGSTAGTGAFHVVVQDASATDQVGTYSVSLLVVPEPGAVGSLLLTATQGSNPLFAGPGQGPLANYDYDFDNGITYYNASDSPMTGDTVPLGATPMDLFDLNYVATPGTQGTFDLEFFTSDTDPLGSFLGGAFDMSSFSNPPIPGTSFMDGSVTITPTPEPASMLGLTVAGIVAFLRRPRRPHLPAM